MADLGTLAIKALNGGLFVVAFALLGEMAVPKRFGGLFSTAPSVALANLLVVLVAKGSGEARDQSTGMVVGAFAMVAVCALGVIAVRELRARRGSLAMCGAWLALTVPVYVIFLR